MGAVFPPLLFTLRHQLWPRIKARQLVSVGSFVWKSPVLGGQWDTAYSLNPVMGKEAVSVGHVPTWPDHSFVLLWYSTILK